MSVHSFPQDFALEFTTEELDEIHGKLQRGEPATKVADYIQLTLKKMDGTLRKTLTQRLSRYRKDKIEGQLVARMQESGALAVARGTLKMDLLNRMNRISELFEARIEKYMEKQKSLPLPLDGPRAELQAYSLHLERTSRLALELGIVPRPAKKFEGEFGVDPETGAYRFSITEKDIAEIEEFADAIEADYALVTEAEFDEGEPAPKALVPFGRKRSTSKG